MHHVKVISEQFLIGAESEVQLMYDGVRSTLRQMEGKENATIQDALNVFQDLCEDIRRQTGSPVEKQDIGDADSMVTGLCSMARTVGKIYRQNESVFSAEQYEARWERAGRKMAEAQKEAEALEEETLRRQAQFASLKEQIQKRKEELQYQKEIQAELEAQLLELKTQQEQELIRQQEQRNAIEEMKNKSRLFTEEKTQIEQEIQMQELKLKAQESENAELRNVQLQMKEQMEALEKQCRVLSQELEKKTEPLTELWQLLNKDGILKEGWMVQERQSEIQQMYEAAASYHELVSQEIANFKDAYSMLVKNLEEGGY